MDYDFSKNTDRRNTGSLKWDVGENELPMWVADMDFETAPCVKNAVKEVAESGIYGYGVVSSEFFESVSSWWERRHHVKFSTEWMIFSTGVVAAISSMVRKLTTPGENVLIQAPVYNIFYNSIKNNGVNVVSNDLIYEQGQYRIDFEDLERKLADPQTTLMILCNPHNPVGKIFSKEELAAIGALCARYRVICISDEIHCDIVRPGKSYVPFASASPLCREVSITCVAASKAFNLAGLQSACVIVPDPFLRHKVSRGLNTDEVAEPNIFAMRANIAAFSEGEAWLNDLNLYLEGNRATVKKYLEEKLPRLRLVESEATYLLWIDISSYSSDSVAFCAELRKRTGLYLSDGAAYGSPGLKFVRMNIATSRSRIEDGLERLNRFLNG